MSRLILLFLLAVTPLLRAGLLDDLGIDSEESKKSENYTCTPKPPPKPPAQHSSAEGLPPLPLPVVPLRRTEKKNPPRPPALIAKIASGPRSNWATNPTDTRNLLRWMAKELKVNFSSVNVPETNVPDDPKTYPILYRTGHDEFEFSPEARSKMRKYLLGGGTLILDACCGKPGFARSAMKEMEKLIPERPPYRLSLDHPVYHSYYDINKIRFRPAAYRAGAKQDQPHIIGIDIGCRTAVFFFRFDVSCGWDNLEDTETHQCIGYDIPTSKVLGANLMAYITSERNAAVPLSKALSYVDADKTKAGKLFIAQAAYTGIWKTREAGLSMLLNTFHEKTKAPVRYERKTVDIAGKKLFDAPFIYFTGHNDFALTEQERSNLASYISRGGIVFAEACCGRAAFDQAFRQELKGILPGSKLEVLPNEHIIFRFPNVIEGVVPRPPLARQLGVEGKIQPRLEAISLDGHIAVLYSPWGLSCGWEMAQCPYCRGIESNDSLALGVNILSHILMQ